MKQLLIFSLLCAFAFILPGCRSVDNRLPAEDIEIFARYPELISILKNPRIPPNSKEKYDAAKEFIKKVDLHFTRETATINKFFNHRDAQIGGLNTETPVFTFNYQYLNKSLQIRFFTYRMFVTRIEIKEK